MAFAAVVLSLAFALDGRASAQTYQQVELPLPFVTTCLTLQMDYDSAIEHYGEAYPNGTSGGHDANYWQGKAQGYIAD